jgi:DNA-binding transcriptional regulator YhcF (GntR family)
MMRNYDRIRGRVPNKTERILEYLVTRPKQVVSPKEVAEALGFNLQTTVTVLNRLALEGTIIKQERGKYCYIEEESTMAKSRGDRFRGRNIRRGEIDAKTASTIYQEIYKMACDSASEAIVKKFTGMTKDSFENDKPLESIQKLAKGLVKVLGKEITDDIVKIALEEYDENKTLIQLIIGD